MTPLMDRLDLAMRHGRYNRSTLSLDLNMSRQAVQNWFSPKVVTQPKIKRLKQIAKLCHCSENWLIYGEGKMLEVDLTENRVREILGGLSDEKLSMVESLSVEEMLKELARLKKINEELQAQNAQLVSNRSAIAYLMQTQDAQ